jgi:hypothetical protein
MNNDRPWTMSAHRQRHPPPSQPLPMNGSQPTANETTTNERQRVPTLLPVCSPSLSVSPPCLSPYVFHPLSVPSYVFPLSFPPPYLPLMTPLTLPPPCMSLPPINILSDVQGLVKPQGSGVRGQEGKGQGQDFLTPPQTPTLVKGWGLCGVL